MPDLPLISIAAISYNTSKYVLQTLESIRNQTYPNIELVIVDDCSTDNSVELINEWLKTYRGKYKFITHKTNKGVCATYNAGLYNSSGRYFTVIDTDDILSAEKTSKQVEILEGSDESVAAVYSDSYLMDENAQPIEGLFIQRNRQFANIPSGNIYETLLQGNYIPCMTMLIKRSVFDDVGGYDESLAYEDYDMWLRIAQKYDILFSGFISCTYRIRQGSLSSTIKNWKLSDTKIFLKHVGRALPTQRLRSIAREVYLTCDTETIPYIKELAIKTADRHILAAWLLCELNIPLDIGETILGSMNESIAGGVQKIINSEDTSAGMFINNVVPALPDAVVRDMARRFYSDGDDSRLPLLRELAMAIKDRYILVVYLLQQFEIAYAAGSAVLSMVNDGTASEWNSAINRPDAPDEVLFLENIVPAVPFEFFGTMSRDAYFAQNSRLVFIVKTVAKKTKDRYLKTVWLLWKHKIRSPVGEIILGRISTYISAGKSRFFIDLCIYKDIFEAKKKYNQP